MVGREKQWRVRRLAISGGYLAAFSFQRFSCRRISTTTSKSAAWLFEGTGRERKGRKEEEEDEEEKHSSCIFYVLAFAFVFRYYCLL